MFGNVFKFLFVLIVLVLYGLLYTEQRIESRENDSSFAVKTGEKSQVYCSTKYEQDTEN